jgi:hypothetical protein
MRGWRAGFHNATIAERKRNEMAYDDKGEATREYYRAQGENREKQRIIALMEMLENKNPGAAWSPKYIMQLVNREINEA